MSVGEICNRVVIFTQRETLLPEAAALMREHHVGSLVVVDEGAQGRVPVGILTDRDIVVRGVAEGLDPSVARVGDVASRTPVAVAPDQDLDEALELMAEHRVRRLPVVDDGRLVGVVSQADVALEAKEKKTGEVVQQISEPSSVARES
jgi:CBS domain-containing protein